ncbi:LpxI family protein [Mesobaculum littorinae]|uniref:LpxI family protein n=1 Tax=Mesobaculum littorinae TaxID=2486419 RepID=A0A438AL37_9RHOB|nr:UDP-2,3-diacylglucosamine diphosphatase LpxI [Mesobaculum littorinae]RVV99541.1 LpxI family protein [Mesobaculum littorinae]
MSVALIAGAGRLPEILLERLGLDARLLVLRDAGAIETRPGAQLFWIEHLGSVIAGLVQDGFDTVVFAGAIHRPSIDPARIDAATAPLAARLAPALGQGDDALLRTVLGFFEEAGLRVRAAHEVVPDLLPPEGVLTEAQPDAVARSDAGRAAALVRALGPLDAGQGCVVAQGQVLAIEALPGTDVMLEGLARWDGPARPDPARGRGLLWKAPKPDQDRRIDLPAIGPGTVAAAARAGLGGIAIARGGVMILDMEKTRETADRLGLFLWVCAP